MTVGDGILWSTVLALVALAAWRATVSRRWKAVGIVTSVIAGLLALAAAGFWSWGRYEDRPQVATKLARISLGMTPVDVTLALGTPTSQTTANGKDGTVATYVYRHTDDSDYALIVMFEQRQGKMRTSIICEDKGASSLLGFSRYASKGQILAKLGSPTHVSIRADGLSELMSYKKWKASFELEQGVVQGLCIFNSNVVVYTTEYKPPEVAHSSATAETKSGPDTEVPVNIPRVLSAGEFTAKYGSPDRPVAIAPPCKDNRATCKPADRMWQLFQGKLEPDDVMTPNGLIYRGK